MHVNKGAEGRALCQGEDTMHMPEAGGAAAAPHTGLVLTAGLPWDSTDSSREHTAESFPSGASWEERHGCENPARSAGLQAGGNHQRGQRFVTGEGFCLLPDQVLTD